jgi:phage gp29-like protein
MDGNPSGYKLSLLSSGGRRPIDVNEIIKRYESRIAMSVLGEFVLLGMDSVGSFALSSNKTALFSQALGTYLSGIADVFNTFAIPRLLRMNGYTDAEYYPEMTYSDIETPDINELAGALSGLTAAGILTPDDELEKWVREYANLPVPEVNENATPEANDGTAREANDRTTEEEVAE